MTPKVASGPGAGTGPGDGTERCGNGEQTPTKRGPRPAAWKHAVESTESGGTDCEGIASVDDSLLGRFPLTSEHDSLRDHVSRRIFNSWTGSHNLLGSERLSDDYRARPAGLASAGQVQLVSCALRELSCEPPSPFKRSRYRTQDSLFAPADERQTRTARSQSPSALVSA